MSNVLVVGAWHLGAVTGTCIADAGHKVSLWDQTPATASAWKTGKAPLRETGLDELVGRLWGKNLFWSDDIAKSAASADWVVLAYDTPVDDEDRIDLTPVNEGLERVLEANLNSHVSFFLTAQLPVGTSRKLQEKMKAKFPNWTGRVIYSPENLRLGTAIASFKNADRVVVGSDHSGPEEKAKIEAMCRDLMGLQKNPFVVMGLESAEMVKHSLNAFLANCIVFANEIADICEASGADAWDVLGSLKQDSRVGPKAFLRPGLGFAGGTLARDVRILSEKKRAQNLFSTLYSLNTQRNDWITSSLVRELTTLKGKRVVLLGVTYKPGTSTMRRSPGIDIGKRLKDEGAIVIATDPQADLGELSAAEREQLPFTLERNPTTALKGADAAVLVTEWPEFKDVAWADLQMNRLLIDPNGYFDKVDATKSYRRINPGRPR